MIRMIDTGCEQKQVHQTHEYENSFVFHENEENAKYKKQKTNNAKTIKSNCASLHTPVIYHREDLLDFLVNFLL